MEAWLKQIDTLTEQFKSLYGPMTIDQFNSRPDPNSWSPAQILQHLIVINTSYYPALEALQRGGKGPGGFMAWSPMANLMGKLILKSVRPETKKKTKTFPIWEPAAEQYGKELVDDFVQEQANLKQHILASKSLLEQDALIASPANPKIVYKLRTAFDIIVAHEQRHLEQARRLVGV